MQEYFWEDGGMIDLQRMPRKTGSDTSTDHLPPQHLQSIYGENILPVIFTDGPLLHTDDHPFCPDWSCICHEEDQESIARVNNWVQEGLMTPQEATQYILGRTY